MFKWLFKKLQLEPPKPARKEVEKLRKAPDKDAYDAVQFGIKKGCMIAAENILREAIPKGSLVYQNQVHMPKPQTPMMLILKSDYEYMKQMRINTAKGNTTTMHPIDNSGYSDAMANEVSYNNAKILHEFYGLSTDEVFQLTGCVI